MKILHTADWHLGKKLEGYDRDDEQKAFLDEICYIANDENVDMIIIAGDIYDIPNPPTYAERLFYEYLKKLSDNGKRAIIVIAGNHDNPRRLTASNPLAYEYGILLFGEPFEKKEIGKYGNFLITKSYEGAVQLELNGKKVFLNVLPYASEKTLNMKISENIDDENRQTKYSEFIGEILNKNLEYKDKDAYHIIVSHLFINGVKDSEIEGSERNIEFGGIYAVDLKDIPAANYVALGHIHKCIKYKNNICYSGSPLEYRLTENLHDKRVLIVDIDGDNTVIKDRMLENIKPIKKYIITGIENAIKLSLEKIDVSEWIYLTIYTDRPIKTSELYQIKSNKNIIVIEPIINAEKRDLINKGEFKIDDEKSIVEAFKEFYYEKNNVYPVDQIVNEFLNCLEEN